MKQRCRRLHIALGVAIAIAAVIHTHKFKTLTNSRPPDEKSRENHMETGMCFGMCAGCVAGVAGLWHQLRTAVWAYYRNMRPQRMHIDHRTKLRKATLKMECILRKWRLSDAEALSKALSNKNILKNLRDGIPSPYTPEDAIEYITAMLNADSNSTFAFAITIQDQVVGSIGAFRCLNIHHRTAEIGYYIAEPFQNMGLGLSAVRQLCRYLFDNTDIIRIFAEPFSHNAASCRVLEKAGFICEGTLRKNAFKDGQVFDMKLYALIRDC